MHSGTISSNVTSTPAGQGRSILEAADGWNAQRASADGHRSEGQVLGVASDVEMGVRADEYVAYSAGMCRVCILMYIRDFYVYNSMYSSVYIYIYT